MVSQKTLKEYGFGTMQGYTDYILESKINGQNKQVNDLINAMSKNQKKDAVVDLLTFDTFIAKDLIIEILVKI